MTPRRLALSFVCGNEQVCRPLCRTGYLQGIRRAYRPALQQLDSTRYNLVRNVDNDRGLHILDQRTFIFGVLWRREFPFTSEPAQSGNNLRMANYGEAER